MPGFLERCREAVARFGKVDRLRTIEVSDGRSLEVPDGAGDLAFSYITLQHCERDDALALVAEAMRAVGPGGQVALHFRSWSGTDPFVLPLGALMRGMFRLPVIGKWLLRHRLPTRLGVAGQPARSPPGDRSGPRSTERCRGLAQLGPQRAAVGGW